VGAELDPAGARGKLAALLEREEHRHDHEARFDLAVLEERLGDTERAARYYREALALNPRLAAAHYNLGLLALARAQQGDAVPSLVAALAIEPRAADIALALGAALAGSGRLDAARDVWLEWLAWARAAHPPVAAPPELEAHFAHWGVRP
jgi:tetratricopeptide (TPR) repeat protein